MHKSNLIFIALAIIFITSALTILRVYGMHGFNGDTAQLYLQLNNVHKGIGAYNPLLPSIMDFLNLHYGTMNAGDICQSDFLPSQYLLDDYNHFKFHAYFILYPISFLVYIFSAEFVSQWVTIFAFIIFIFLCYYIAIANKASKIFACTLALSITLHPAWSWAIQGQPYVDRWYLPFGLLIFYLVDRDKKNIIGLFLLLAISSLIVEKVFIYNSIFLFAYALLSYKNEEKKYFFIQIVASVVSLIIFYCLLKLYLKNFYYSTSIPFSYSELVNLFNYPGFIAGTVSLVLVSLPFMLPAIFVDKKLFIISLIMLAPNIFGNIGGAEKIGYVTHYHTLYFPFLAYVFITSIVKIYIKFQGEKTGKYLCFIYLLCVSIFYYGLNFSADSSIKFSINSSLNYVRYFVDDFNNLKFDREPQKIIDSIVPKNSSVTSIEAGLPLVYQYKNIHFYPLNLGKSDFVITGYIRDEGSIKLTGYFGYKGQNHIEETNKCMERVLKSYYDTEHLVLLNNYLALLKRRE